MKMILAAIIPIYSCFILRFKLDADNAAAIAATYGSIFLLDMGLVAAKRLDDLKLISYLLRNN